MKKLTASHKMLFVALIIYILIALVGIYSVLTCISDKQYETATSIIIALFSYATICGSSIFVVYSNKASKENVLEISVHKCEARLNLAKTIYKDIALGKVDEKSISLVKILIQGDNDNNLEIPNINIPNITTPPLNTTDVVG